MPATWITDRPSTRRRSPPPAEAPRLELPLRQPTIERARPAREAVKRSDEPERGAAVIDFYV